MPRYATSAAVLFLSVLPAFSPAEARAGDGAPPIAWVGAGQYDVSALDVTPDGQLLVTSSATRTRRADGRPPTVCS